MYIFDCFTEEKAKLFANRLKKLKRKATVHPDQESSNKIHPFQFELEGWIVIAEYHPNDTQWTGNVLADIAEEYHGEYAGTEIVEKALFPPELEV